MISPSSIHTPYFKPMIYFF